ncbi:hypothetical protein O2N63_04840 [Aliiroseovarius sp. KMU-50]|uniref:Uncharacterized protein n=1 Tax=Aliiroseovarius salicola TaxID=3009082 RepID=A0ABT4VZ10_9RHOB|nr:hypothetical protein [Aliiroseovarius sp. KMU-50]MDA5093409.1 hypothetical protein [Aliiroseovarius sp. KMU-50]
MTSDNSIRSFLTAFFRRAEWVLIVLLSVGMFFNSVIIVAVSVLLFFWLYFWGAVALVGWVVVCVLKFLSLWSPWCEQKARNIELWLDRPRMKAGLRKWMD